MGVATINLGVSSSTQLRGPAMSIRRRQYHRPLLLAACLQVHGNCPCLQGLAQDGGQLGRFSAYPRGPSVTRSILYNMFHPLPRAYTLSVRACVIAWKVPLHRIRDVVALTTSRLRGSKPIVTRRVDAPTSLREVIAIRSLQDNELSGATRDLVLARFPRLVLSRNCSLFLLKLS